MARYIGSSPTITLGSGFTTGNQTRDSMYDFLKAMGGVSGSAPGIFSLNEIHAQLKANNWSFEPTTTAVNTPTNLSGTLTLNGIQIGGSGVCDYTVKVGDQTISSYSNSTWFTNTQDTRFACIHVKGNLTINAGQTMIPSHRKLGTYIYVSGNLVLNGTISMKARGANHSGTAKKDIRLINGTHGSYTNPTIPATGMAGGARGQSPTGANQQYHTNSSKTLTAFATGGGYHGFAFSEYTWGQGGKGADGTCFSGGGGGGCARGAGNNGVNLTGATNATENGGKGGNSTHTLYGCSGSAGNPGGNGSGNSSGTSGRNGTGGVVVIFVEGTVSGSGVVNVQGENTIHSGATGSGTGQGSAAGMCTIFCGTNSSSVALRRESGPLAGSGGTLESTTGTDGSATGLATNSFYYPFDQAGFTGNGNVGGSPGGFGEIIASL